MRFLGTRELGTSTSLLGAAGVAVSIGSHSEWSAIGTFISGVVIPVAGILLKLALELNKSSESNRKRDAQQDERLDALEEWKRSMEGRSANE